MIDVRIEVLTECCGVSPMSVTIPDEDLGIAIARCLLALSPARIMQVLAQIVSYAHDCDEMAFSMIAVSGLREGEESMVDGACRIIDAWDAYDKTMRGEESDV